LALIWAFPPPSIRTEKGRPTGLNFEVPDTATGWGHTRNKNNLLQPTPNYFYRPCTWFAEMSSPTQQVQQATGEKRKFEELEEDEMKNDLKMCDLYLQKLKKSFADRKLTPALVNYSLVSLPSSSLRPFAVVDGDPARDYFDDPVHADIVLTVGQQSYFCHRAYLMRRSDYFRGMFHCPMVESTAKHVHLQLPYPEPQLVKFVLEYIYTGVIGRIRSASVIALLHNAEFLGVAPLQKAAVEVIADRILDKGETWLATMDDFKLPEIFLMQILPIVSEDMSAGEVFQLILRWWKNADTDKIVDLVRKHVDIQGLRPRDIEGHVELFSKDEIWEIGKRSAKRHSSRSKSCSCSRCRP